jgi:hypothetical protein
MRNGSVTHGHNEVYMVFLREQTSGKECSSFPADQIMDNCTQRHHSIHVVANAPLTLATTSAAKWLEFEYIVHLKQ